MPRASRYLVEGYTYHLTHRCHDRDFLLKFQEERDAYREWLRVAAQRYQVPVFAYCITSNHVHVVAHAVDKQAIGQLMQLPASSVATQLNKRKNREGSMWEHPYHCTLIEGGEHLLNCLRYVDLNMVRCGKVRHPREWRWCGYDELTGTRKRYRILDIPRLVQHLHLKDDAELVALHTRGIAEKIDRAELAREEQWTDALAVGSKEFIAKAKTLFGNRRTFIESEETTGSSNGAWMIREDPSAYGSDFEPKSGV